MSLNWRVLVVMLILVISGLPALAGAQEVSKLGINSARYIVIDAATGNVYAQRNADKRVAIASITKIFTAVQAMEMASLDTPITTADWDLRSPDGGYFGSNGTLMGFDAGETFTLEDMLYGMLLPSGNDAANAIARTLGGQPGDSNEEAAQRFIALVNQRVIDMGLEDTHFMNPHGWGEDDHYSTAADIATFARLVANYPVLMRIMGTKSYTTSNGELTVTNTNRSLTLYPSVIAGKTGYDWDAGYCLLNFARRGDITMIAVTLDGIAPDDWYDDSARLLEYGFEQQAEGGSFRGDVLTYTDPSAPEIARSAHPEGRYLPIGAPEIVNERIATPTALPMPTKPQPTAESAAVAQPTSDQAGGNSGKTVAIVLIIAGGMLMAAGYQAWRTQPERVVPPDDELQFPDRRTNDEIDTLEDDS